MDTTRGRWGHRGSAAAPSAMTNLGVLAPPSSVSPHGVPYRNAALKQLLVSAGLEKHQELFGGCESVQNSVAPYTSPAPIALCSPHSSAPIPQDPHPYGSPLLPPHYSSMAPQQHAALPAPRAPPAPTALQEVCSCSVPPQALICSSQGLLCADKHWVLLHADPQPRITAWGGGGMKLNSGGGQLGKRPTTSQ